MAFEARIPALIFDRKVFPFLDIAQAVKAVGEISAMNSEVIRNKKDPCDKDACDQSDCYPQRAQYVPLHFRRPLGSFRT
jgi:hypothetical protein